MSQKEQHTSNFNELGIEKNLLNIIRQKGFTIPTPIQHQVIPGSLRQEQEKPWHLVSR